MFKEKIASPAVWFEKEAGNDQPDLIMCLNYEGDERLENHRFHLSDLGIKYREDKGFITSWGRFVDAREAMAIALEYDQLPYLNGLNKAYNEEIMASRGTTENATLIFKAMTHQRSILESRELTPKDLYR